MQTCIRYFLDTNFYFIELPRQASSEMTFFFKKVLTDLLIMQVKWSNVWESQIQALLGLRSVACILFFWMAFILFDHWGRT